MNTGRPTADPKGESVRIRINADTRNRLDKISLQTGESISEIIRKAIQEYISHEI